MPEHPDDIAPPNLLNLCQQIAVLKRYHENCVAHFSDGEAKDEKKKLRHSEFVKTLAAVTQRVCKRAKVKPIETPALASVLLFASEIGLPEDQAKKFFYHFESNGWQIGGRTKVKNWEARMRLWKEEYLSRQSKGGPPKKDFNGGF